MTLEGRIALVTGSGGDGMGRSIALTLARDGADVMLNYRTSEQRARETAAAIDAFGRLDIVVASAGAPWKPQDVTEIAADHLRRVLAAEVEGVYSLLRAALPGMRQRGWGRIVLIGGHLADAWRFGPPDAPLDYPLGKAARHWLARTLGPRELAHRVTVNAVAPGPTARFTHEQALAALRMLPPGDGNTPQHIAEAVAFLCSDAASRISGAVIPVPGAREV
jgi:NAD(P)-dependent dehydrogenase (short-subunit alcohol dehydrogenase family)